MPQLNPRQQGETTTHCLVDVFAAVVTAEARKRVGCSMISSRTEYLFPHHEEHTVHTYIVVSSSMSRSPKSPENRAKHWKSLHTCFHPAMDVDGAPSPSNLPSSMCYARGEEKTSPANSARPEIKNLARGRTPLPIKAPLMEVMGEGQRRVGAGASGREIPSRPRDKGSLRPAAPPAEVHGAGDVG